MAGATAISPTGLTRRTWRSTLGVIWAVAEARLRIMSRYPLWCSTCSCCW
jgi:hypothetical protein